MAVIRVGERSCVVVGVDRSPAARGAVLWAAEEARLRGLGLIIAHVAPTPSRPGSAGSVAGGQLLNFSAAAASHREPGIVVGTRLLRGMVSEELVQLTRNAAVLVIGIDQRKPRSAHGALGAVEDRIAVHADCPVVAVPRVVDSLPRAPDRKVVAVWPAAPGGGAVLGTAALEAQLRHAQLSVIAQEPAETPSSDGAVADGQETLERRLTGQLADLTRDYPRIAVVVTWAPDDFAGAVARTASNEFLLVVGVHHANDRWSVRTGALATAVMRAAACPVMLIGLTMGERTETGASLGVTGSSGGSP